MFSTLQRIVSKIAHTKGNSKHYLFLDVKQVSNGVLYEVKYAARVTLYDCESSIITRAPEVVHF